MYLYLSSDNSSGYHSSNTGDDFVVTLPSAYYFSRNEMWEIGLVDLYLSLPWRVQLSKKDSNRVLHVYCDSVEQSVYNGSERKLLTVTRFKDCYKTFFSPHHIRYVALSQERLTTIRLYLKYSDGESISLQELTSSCTLHIRKQPK